MLLLNLYLSVVSRCYDDTPLAEIYSENVERFMGSKRLKAHHRSTVVSRLRQPKPSNINEIFYGSRGRKPPAPWFYSIKSCIEQDRRLLIIEHAFEINTQFALPNEIFQSST